MKKYRIAALLTMLVCLLTACGNSADHTTERTAEEATVVQTPQEETADQSDFMTGESNESTADTVKEEDAEQQENILIAYFTWADNTVIEDQDAAIGSALDHYESVGDAAEYDGVDATTSASLLVPGNVARIAGWIQQEIGGDLFSIQTEEPYSSDYDECMERASDEKAQNARPALATHVENMEQYDTVYIGYPNWWYSCPMALLSFLEEYDLSGKHIVLFCSHGTGGLSGSVEDIKAVLPEDCTVEENVLGVYRPEVPNSQNAVLEWLQEVR